MSSLALEKVFATMMNCCPIKNRGELQALFLVALIAISALIARVFLVFNDRQVVLYDGKEYFNFSLTLAMHVQDLDLSEVIHTPVFGHWGAVLWGVFPVLMSPNDGVIREFFALFFALPVLGSIFLIYYIAKQLRFSLQASLISAMLFASSFSNIYLARHGMPTNLAMSFFLLAIYLSTCGEKNRAFFVFMSGLSAFFCFFTYYGYWMLAGIALFFAVIHSREMDISFPKKFFWVATGFFLPLLVFILLGLIYGVDVIKHFLFFGKTITQGSYEEGHKVPFLFLWHSEYLLSILWLTCIIVGVYRFFFMKAEKQEKYLLGGILSIYCGFIVFSNFLEWFVVYGRLVTQLVPLLCLLSGLYLSKLNIKFISFAFFMIAAGYTYNYIALRQSVTLEGWDVIYQDLKKKCTDETHVVLKAGIFESHYYKFFSKKYEHCQTLFSYAPFIQSRFMQYDETSSPFERKIRQRFDFYRVILRCPAGHPDNPSEIISRVAEAIFSDENVKRKVLEELSTEN